MEKIKIIKKFGSIAKTDEVDESEISEGTTELLKKYDDIFEAPTSFPPFRRREHFIHTFPNSKPILVRLYRYPQYQKAEMESLVKEMLQQGIVRPSTSSYSSLVILIKKKDGGWRLCVDYRALNSITVKDRFPIPTIDELLGELNGATIFSKLDLRSGYHQIRINPTDVSKTTFRTHSGHFEFLVMSFGLTNAPATFQALMNDIFEAHLRKFVIVFFDDMLIFSKSGKDHTNHLTLVFEILRKNSLATKMSKCSFEKKQLQF